MAIIRSPSAIAGLLSRCGYDRTQASSETTIDRLLGASRYGKLRIEREATLSQIPDAIKEGEMLQKSELQSLPATSPDQRKVVHDLRNLFAIIGAGKSLLERDPAPARRKEAFAAIEEATRQGARLTTDLLANCTGQTDPMIVDVDQRLAKLAPMIRVLTNAHVDFANATGQPVLARMVPEDFDAVLLEIVSNAVAAGATVVVIRAHSCGDGAWMLVSDNGCGMSPATRARAYRGADLGLAHGTGLSRIRQFMERSGGHLRIRSRPGGGTQIGLIFPPLPKAEPDLGGSELHLANPLGAEGGQIPVFYPAAA